ncbi:MAG TPA: PilZ domain-containing protein [Chloroflexota bacterium]|nr:PilZ domain-containing protein [Chloroflexota bacterium]
MSNSNGKPTTIERRRAERVAWRHHNLDPLVVEVEEPGEDWRRVPCTLVDLAAGGVGMLVGEPLEPGSRVRLTFPLPESLHDGDGPVEITPFSALAEVVHARHLPDPAHAHVPDESHLPHHRGARFRDMEGDAEMRLMRALYGSLPAGWAVEKAGARYAVLRNGERIAGGFTSYDRARARAMSLHMDDVATRRRKPSGAVLSRPDHT